MASLFGHLSIAALYWIFPGKLSLIGLIVGSLITDIDSLPRALMSMRKAKTIEALKGREKDPRLVYLTEWFTPGDLPLHNLLGCVIVFPLALGISYGLESALSVQHSSMGILSLSISIGLLFHLIIDLPAHAYVRYLTPFEKMKPAPFLLFKKVTFLKCFYPFKEIEKLLGRPEYSVLPLFNYLVLSSVFPLIAVCIVLFVRMF